MKISVVSPVYRAENIVKILVERLIKNLSEITSDFEIILVEDGSQDLSWQAIELECGLDKRVKGIKLSRNFGQHYAISAGLQATSGEWVVVMDCDLQDQPEEIPRLFNKALEGYDIVFAKRLNRRDSWFKRKSSILFHSVLRFLSGLKTDSTVANFGIYHKKVIQEINKMPEKARSFPSLLIYLGFDTSSILVEHAARFEGNSTYSLRKMLKLSFDVILVNSNRPLTLSVVLGFCISMLAFLLAIYNVFAQLAGIITVPGYTTTIFSIWFVGGLLMFVLGFIGLYIGKIFDQVKDRQLYVISKSLNISEE